MRKPAPVGRQVTFRRREVSSLKRKSGILAPLLIGGLIAAAIVLIARADFMRQLELRLLDYRYTLRDQFPLRPVPVSRDIVLVLIDDATLDKIKEPLALWVPHWAQAFKGILDGGATAVGLDVVLAYAQDGQLASLAPLLADPPSGKPYVERIVLIGFLDDHGVGTRKVVKPLDDLIALVNAQNVALANLTRDEDGIPRAQAVVPMDVADSATNNSTWIPLAALLAEKHTGRRIDPVKETFGDAPLPLIDGRRILINYTGPRPPFARLSLADVLDHVQRNDAAWLKTQFEGKVVLMGPGTFSQQDTSETPFTSSGSGGAGVLTSMLGIEVQANILNTLLTGAFLNRASRPQNALFVLLVSLVTALLAWRLSVFKGMLVSLLIMLAVFGFGYWMFAAQSVWVNIAAPLTAVPLVWGGVFARRYAVEEKEKRVIRDMFGKYVSNEIMEEILANPDTLKLGGERREVTVFFSDINGFTTASETHPPEVVVGMLNRYLDEMTRIVFRHNGTLEQFVGDEIMVLFGAPQSHGNAETAAVQTALDMIETLDRLRAADPDASKGFYEIKVGIHTGRPIIGNIGTAERVQYTAIGDMVNLASRIMNMTKKVGGTILISETTYERVKDMPDVEFIDHGDQDVRGRQNTVRIYEVRARKKSEEVQSIAAVSSRSSS